MAAVDQINVRFVVIVFSLRYQC